MAERGRRFAPPFDAGVDDINERFGGQRRFGWLGTDPDQFIPANGFAAGESTYLRTYIVRLENPQPQRRVAGIRLDVPPGTPGLVFLGITLEPPAALRSTP